MDDTGTTSDTPLSDLIAVHIASGSPENWARFLDEFRKTKVGVHAVGVPEGVSEFTSTADQPVSVAFTAHAGGQPMVLAYADPMAFSARFGQRFNAGMVGESVLATVLLHPDCTGVLVNSALVEMSVVIDRPTVEWLLQPADDQPPTKPWWRFW